MDAIPLLNEQARPAPNPIRADNGIDFGVIYNSLSVPICLIQRPMWTTHLLSDSQLIRLWPQSTLQRASCQIRLLYLYPGCQCAIVNGGGGD